MMLQTTPMRYSQEGGDCSLYCLGITALVRTLLLEYDRFRQNDTEMKAHAQL